MKLFHPVFRAAALAIVCAAQLAVARVPLKDGPQDADIARRVVNMFSREHLSRAPFDDEMSMRVWTNYISLLDFERVYFTASDIRQFEARKGRLAEEIKGGNLSFGFDVFNVFMDRLSNRYDYACSLLTNRFDVTVNESYVWKRKDAPWPQDEAEWNELWRKRMKNEYVRVLVDREIRKTEAAKKKNGTEAPATNATDSAEAAPDPDANLSPEEFIRKRYKQLVTVMNDSDAQWVTERFLTAVTQAYDPHSGYMSPSSREDFDIEMKLSLCGIGAILRPEDGAAKIERTIPGGPADRDKREKRLRPGDRIIAVAQDNKDMVDILHWPLEKAVRLIRGPKGSRVVLKVIPATDPTGSRVKLVDLYRDEVKLEEQAAKGKLRAFNGGDGKSRRLAVVKLPAFYANMQASAGDADYRSSTDDIRKVIEAMKAEGAEGVLLDLRGNGGGSLVEAIRMTGLFVRSGPVVQVRERQAVRVLPDPDEAVVYDGPLVVLVNRLSASASEILAGALQDYGRAIIVGDSKTHGKGTVQSVLDLSRDQRFGSVRLTSASFYRISGSSTQLKGITSDIVVKSPLDCMEIGEDSLVCPMPWTRIPPAYYRPIADLAPVIEQLKQHSIKRQTTDPRFIAYVKLLDRIEAMNKTRELSLQFDERLKMAASEKEILDLQDSLVPESTPDTEKDEQKDLVLNEALAILSDFAGMQAVQAAQRERLSRSDEEENMTFDFAEWLRGALQR